MISLSTSCQSALCFDLTTDCVIFILAHLFQTSSHPLGSRRFSRMKNAVHQGLTVPPVDLRYLTKPHGREEFNSMRSGVVSFLMGLYESVAETLPNFREPNLDEPDAASCSDVVVMENAWEDEPDPYSELIDKPELPKDKLQEKGKKIRKSRGSIQVNVSRKPELGGNYEVRWLPPGQMKDHWEQYKLGVRNSAQKPASFTLFWRAP